jgi:hypothetical protein
MSKIRFSFSTTVRLLLLVIVVRLVSAPVRTFCDFLPPLEPRSIVTKPFRRVTFDRQHVRTALKSSVYVGKTNKELHYHQLHTH